MIGLNGICKEFSLHNVPIVEIRLIVSLILDLLIAASKIGLRFSLIRVCFEVTSKNWHIGLKNSPISGSSFESTKISLKNSPVFSYLCSWQLPFTYTLPTRSLANFFSSPARFEITSRDRQDISPPRHSSKARERQTPLAGTTSP